MGAIRKINDPVYHVTCNYEKGGTKISSPGGSYEGYKCRISVLTDQNQF